MPQPYESAVMTLEGEKLLARASAGLCRPVYVCMAVGNGTYTSAEKQKSALKSRTALKSEKNRYAFSDKYVDNKNRILLTALITNYDQIEQKAVITSAYYVNEIGIYAKEEGQQDREAKLISICVTASTTGNGDFMPPYDGYNATTITQGYYLTVDDEANVVVNTSGAALLKEDANIIMDEDTKKLYRLSIKSGKLCYQEVVK